MVTEKGPENKVINFMVYCLISLNNIQDHHIAVRMSVFQYAPVLDSRVTDDCPCFEPLKMTLHKARRIRSYREVVLKPLQGCVTAG